MNTIKDYFKEKDDWYEKCLKCQHSYRKNNDSDMIYCRCRRGKCNFKEVEGKNADSEVVEDAI